MPDKPEFAQRRQFGSFSSCGFDHEIKFVAKLRFLLTTDTRINGDDDAFVFREVLSGSNSIVVSKFIPQKIVRRIFSFIVHSLMGLL